MGNSVRGAAVAIVAMALCASPAAAEMGFKSQRWVSPDGDSVALLSSDQLVPEDTDSALDLYVWRSGTYHLAADAAANPFYLSDDGTRVLFTTTAALAASDTDRQSDVYLSDAGTIKHVSTGPTDPGNVSSDWPNASGPEIGAHADDGRTVFFHTKGAMVAQDDDGDYDVYKWENGTTTLVSTNASGANVPGSVLTLGASADGDRVVMSTTAALLSEDADGGHSDAYAREGGTLELVTKGSTRGAAAHASVQEINSDATSVVWNTNESLDPRDLDLHRDVYQRLGSTTRLISANASGVSTPCSAALTDPRGGEACGKLAVDQSDDGAHVFFTSFESMVSADRNQLDDLYDRVNGSTTEWVSVGAQTMGDTRPELVLYRSGHVLFDSGANLASGGGSGGVYDRFAGTTRFVGNGLLRAASPDAGRVVFVSNGQLVPEDTDRYGDLYEHHGGATRLITTGPAGGSGDHFNVLIGQSEDAAEVYFQTEEQLTADDTDTTMDIYRRANGVTTLVGGFVGGS